MTAFRRLDENTSLPFKVVLPIMVTMVSGILWIQHTLAAINADLKASISRVEIVTWRNQLADQNRTLSVPYIPQK